MLVLSRRVTESIEIGDDIHIRVIEIRGNRVKLAIDAPREVSIRRSELPRKEGASGGLAVGGAAAASTDDTRVLSSLVMDAVV